MSIACGNKKDFGPHRHATVREVRLCHEDPRWAWAEALWQGFIDDHDEEGFDIDPEDMDDWEQDRAQDRYDNSVYGK